MDSKLLWKNDIVLNYHELELLAVLYDRTDRQGDMPIRLATDWFRYRRMYLKSPWAEVIR